jgi:tetratricopeptide (TPR) repeat protein
MLRILRLLVATVSVLIFSISSYAQNMVNRLELLDKAKYLSEVGNYSQAIELLDEYKTQIGEDQEYLKIKARVLALSGDSAGAIKILEPLLSFSPNDYGLMYSKTLAIASGRDPQSLLSHLATLSELDPESIDTKNINRVLRASLKPEIGANFAFQNNSDGTSFQLAGISASNYISPTLKIFGGADSLFMHATDTSGYAAINGSSEVTYNRAWLGVRKLINKSFEVDALGGGGKTSFHSNGVYEIGVNYWQGNKLNGRFSHRQDLVTVSPLAASIGVLRNSNRLEANWTPDYKNTIASSFNYDTYSGNNTRWEVNLAPRRSFIRSSLLNLDLGLSGQWLGFSKPNALGYYSPSSYSRYAVTFFSYWKIDDDSGLSVVGSAGPQKGDPMTAYRMSGGIGAEYFYGIYKDLFFKVSLSALNYGATQGANYRSNNLMFSLTYRGF